MGYKIFILFYVKHLTPRSIWIQFICHFCYYGPLTLFFFKLRYNWHIIDIILVSVYSIMIWCLYTLKLSNNSNYHLSPCRIKFFFVSLVMRTFRIYFLSNFQICATIILTVVTVLHVTSSWLTYFIAGSLYLLTPWDLCFF